MKFYVDIHGSDERDGSISSPFQTIERAKQAVKDGDTVCIRQGRYFFQKTLKFTEADKKSVTFQAYENETVYFDGGIVIDAKNIKKNS